jgi:predicted MPP superfamily phosphohydrolase
MQTAIVKQINVPIFGLPEKAQGFRIAHLSDLHLRRWGHFHSKLQSILLDEQFDIMLITGDICDRPGRHERSARLLERLLSPIRPPLGIYGVLGNHDHARLAEYDLPLTFLRNTSRPIEVAGSSIYLVGIEQLKGRRGKVCEVMDAVPRDSHVLMMAHYPSTIFELPVGAGVVMFSGHTHGGQIRLPLFGCVFPNDRIPRTMARGLHSVSGNWLHVSPGIGVSPPIFTRFLCPPEISMITLGGCRQARRRRRSSRRRGLVRS